MKIILLTIILIVLISNLSLHAQWVQTNGPSGSIVLSLVVKGTNLFAGTEGGGVYLTTNNGTSWSTMNTGLTNNVVTSLVVIDTNLFAGTYGDGVFLSTNNGMSWKATNVTSRYRYVNALAVSGTNLFVGADDGEYLTTDNGTSWNEGRTIDNVQAFAVSDSNLFAGTWYGGVYLSTNNGTSWNAVNNGLTNKFVYALIINNMNLFAGTDSGVFLSTNNGTSWKTVNNGLPHPVWTFAVSGTNLFAGTDGGVHLTTNNGTSWSTLNTGLTNHYVRDFEFSGTNLFVGTWGGGVWKRPLSQMITSVWPSSDVIPKSFSLDQNYPNPFNPVTEIGYYISTYGWVTINIYDILGRNIKTLVNEKQSPGFYHKVWNAENNPSGIYYYTLITNNGVRIKKMIFLK